MKWNDEVSKLLEEFTDDLLLLSENTVEYTQSFVQETSEILKQLSPYVQKENNKKNTLTYNDKIHNLIKDSKKLSKSTEMQFNSNLLYAFTIFEKFIADLIKLNYKRNKDFKKKYKEKFANLAKSKSKEGDNRFISMLIDDQKILDNYQEIPNLIKELSRLLKVKIEDKSFKNFYFLFIEARERRNLLTHRGKLFDEQYIYRIKNRFGKHNQQSEKFLIDNIFYGEEKKLKKISELIGKSANASPLYFYKVIQVLLYVGIVLHVSSFHLSKSEMIKHGTSYITNSLHQLLIFSFKHPNLNFWLVNNEIRTFFSKYNKEIKLSEYGYIDQVNFCLLYQYTIDILLDLKKHPELKNKNFKSVKHPDYLQMLTCNNSNYKIHHKIANAYFKNDIKGLIAAANELINAKDYVSKSYLKEWYLFERLRENTEIKKFLYTENDESKKKN